MDFYTIKPFPPREFTIFPDNPYIKFGYDNQKPKAPKKLPDDKPAKGYDGLGYGGIWISPQEQRDLEAALRQQQEYDAEDELLRLELEFLEEDTRMQEELEALQGPSFACGICLDEMPMSDVARVESCGHELCRDCLRGYTISKIGDRQYPIPCPLCAAEVGDNEPGGTLLGLFFPQPNYIC